MHRNIASIVLSGLIITAYWSAPTYAEQTRKSLSFDEDDKRMYAELAHFDRSIEQQGLIYMDKDLQAYVEQIGMRLIQDELPPRYATWRFRVIRNPVPNAFALPNGSIYVHSGLFSLLETEAQLAAVLAHEMTHVYEYHSILVERDRRKKAESGPLLSGLFRPIDGVVGNIIALLGDVVVIHAVRASMAGYSRELEEVADKEGLGRLIKAEYDGSGMVKMLEKLMTVESESRSFYANHPRTSERIEYINLQLTSVNTDSTASTGRIGRESYQSAVMDIIPHNIYQALTYRQFSLAFFFSRKLGEEVSLDADRLVILADVYRALGPRTATFNIKALSQRELKIAKEERKNMTWNEADAALKSTSGGRNRMRANLQQAEKFYRLALEKNPDQAQAYRGLGFIYEEYRQKQEAVDHFRRYMELIPFGLDRVQIKQRIDALSEESGK